MERELLINRELAKKLGNHPAKTANSTDASLGGSRSFAVKQPAGR